MSQFDFLQTFVGKNHSYPGLNVQKNVNEHILMSTKFQHQELFLPGMIDGVGLETEQHFHWHLYFHDL